MEGFKKLLSDYLVAVLVATSMAILIRTLFFEAYKIPTDFMSPTLLPGDYIFINKLVHKYGAVGPIVIPERGSVVVFNFPADPNKDFIKRVIGVQGDRIEIRNKILYVNSVQVTHFNSKTMADEQIGKHKYQVEWSEDAGQIRDMSLVRIQEGQIFVLGDNRSRGQDSRNWGLISYKFIKGKAAMIWFSRDVAGSTTRWDRLFHAIR